MKTRNVLAGICALAVMGAAEAQRSASVPRIGVVTIGVGASSPYLEAFRQGLREHGYIEGKNIHLEYRFAQGKAERRKGLPGWQPSSSVSI